MKGSYVLIIKMEHPKRIRIGRLGDIDFSRGFYAYVGSALNGLERRIERHLGKRKKTFWHIDYLLEEADVAGFFLVEGAVKSECSIAGMLSAELGSVPRFGCSDCRCVREIVSGTLDELERREAVVSRAYIEC